MTEDLPPTNGVGIVNTPKRRLIAGALALTLVAAACGSDDDDLGRPPTHPAATDAPADDRRPDDRDHR
jgi:hypothetical protein